MPTYKYQHTIQDEDMLSKDRYVTSWYVRFPAEATQGMHNAIAGAVKNFYGLDVNTKKIADYHADTIAGAGSSVKAYLCDNAPHHEPLFTDIYTMPDGDGAALNFPNEVACVLSYRATGFPDVPLGRTRGRTYIGPLNTSAAKADAPSQPSRPADFFMGTLLSAAERFFHACITAGGSWVVHSPTLMKANAALSDFTVNEISVDDAWDTQRRRGVQASKRQKMPLIGP